MSIFTKTITLALCTTVLFACHKATDPKAVSVQFIENLNAGQLDEAAALATPGTQSTVEAFKSEVQPAAVVGQQKGSAQSVFATDALQAYISGNSAIVKNNLVTLNLEKAGGDWQVVASKELVDDLVHRGERVAQVKTSWDLLKAEYLNRSVLLRDYITYVKGSGKETPEVAALAEALKKAPIIKADPSKEDLLAFIKGQQAIDQVSDKALQPTLNASADLTMNYIINVQSQASKIKEAKAAYNSVAAGAHSPVYVVVP